MINKEITALFQKVLLVYDDKKEIMSAADALKLAEERGMDLICVADKTKTAVCKLGIYEKLLYNQQKAEKEAKKNQRQNKIKEIQISLGIADHDLQIKLEAVKKFILQGNQVRILLKLHGRLIARADDLGIGKINEVIEKCSEFAKPKNKATVNLRTVSVILEKK